MESTLKSDDTEFARRVLRLTILAFLLILFGAGCSLTTDAPGSGDLRPLGSGEATSSDQTSTERNSKTGDDRKSPGDRPLSDSPTAPPGGESGPAARTTDEPGFGVGGTRTDDPNDLAVVRALLARYDELVTRLAASPDISADPAAPVRWEWAQLVPAESALSDGVLDQLVWGPLSTGTRLVPGPDGVSFRHHVDRTGRRDDNSIEFSWCGYSPGIRVDATSGAVVDDKVAHLRGIGRADRDATQPDRWVLDAFNQLDMVILAAGSGDPCPVAKGATYSGSRRRP